jgi:hypothetical protein
MSGNWKTVANLIDTAKEKCPGGCSSWIRHWERATKQAAPKLCPSLGCNPVKGGSKQKGITSEGCHVQVLKPPPFVSGIVPLCSSCNGLEHSYAIDPDVEIIGAKALPTCGPDKF